MLNVDPEDLVRSLGQQPEVELAAMIVNVCRFDPLVVICGYEGAKRLEQEDFNLATAYRAAVARIIVEVRNKSSNS